MKSPADRHQLIVDEEAAAVVREIFQTKLSGLSARKITESLNEREIPSPAQYALNHKRGMDWRRVNQLSAWDSSKVVAILKDERYAGNMVSLRRTLNGIYGRDTAIEKETWVRVEGAHEAIISYEEFLRTQETFPVCRKSQPKTNQRYNAFRCARCGRKLSYSRDRKKFICRYGESNPAAECYRAAYPAEVLKHTVLTSLKWHFDRFVSWEQFQAAGERRLREQLDPAPYERQMELLEKRRTRLYEKYRDGGLRRDEYIQQKSSLSQQVKACRSRLDAIRPETDAQAAGAGRMNPFSELAARYRDADELTKELEMTFVEEVLVYDLEHIKIKWKFEDVFLTAGATE